MFLLNCSKSRILKGGAWCILLLFFTSCATMVPDPPDPFNGRILAEYSLMKKRIPLIERENDILRKENHQYRTKIQDLEVKIREIDSELASLKEKYDSDMTAGREQIKNLELAVQEIVNKSTAKINTLISLKTALEKKMTRDVKMLKEQLAMQKNAFDREREQIIKQNTLKESKLSGQLDVLKKNVEKKALKISSLEAELLKISTKLHETTTLADKLRKARDESLSELESVEEINADLVDQLNALKQQPSGRSLKCP